MITLEQIKDLLFAIIIIRLTIKIQIRCSTIIGETLTKFEGIDRRTD
jgi:hypothetical protein